MINVFKKRLIRIIAVALIAVVGFTQPAGEYVSLSPQPVKEAKAAEETPDPTDDVEAATGSASGIGEVYDALKEDDTPPEGLPEDLNYVSEVRLFSGQDKDKTKEACKKFGYTLVDSDLNQGTGKDTLGKFFGQDGAYVYLGYKTTKDRSQAITSLKMMEMDSGYQSFDYEEIEAGMNTGMAIIAEDIVVAVAETLRNIKNGDVYASKVKENLDLYYIPYMKNKGLGELLLDPSTKAGTIATMLKRSNTAVINNILSYLTMGVSGTKLSGYEGNLAERITKISGDLAGMQKSEYATLDALYKDEVTYVRESLQKYANMIEPAIKLYQEAGETISDEFLKEHPEEALMMGAYNKLNEYMMADGTGVGTYLYRLGTSTLKSKSDMRAAYPLVMAMSPGQLVMFQYTGVFDLANYLDHSEAAIAQGEEALARIKEKVKNCGLEETKDGRIPIYPGDVALYRSKVAMTTDAMRAAAAKEEYHKITQGEKDMALWAQVYTWGNRIMVFAMAAYFIGAGIAWVIMHTSLQWLAETVAATVFSAMGTGVGLIGNNPYTFVIFILVMAGMYLYFKIMDWDRKYNPHMSEVPHYMYDVNSITNKDGKKENKYTLYTAAYNVGLTWRNGYSADKLEDFEYQEIGYEDSSSTAKKKKKHNELLFSDFNARQGKKWNALYYTKSSDAGSPICAEDVNKIFKVKKGGYYKHLSGYEAFVEFGNSAPANLNANQYSDKVDGIYLYYRTEDTMLDPEAAQVKGGGKYVSDVILISEDKEKDAKALIKMKAGKYQFLDKNLTPNQDCYTYLGYSETDDVDAAIRDIRVDPVTVQNAMGGGMRRGNAGYAFCGTTEEGTLSLYQTAVSKDEKKADEENEDSGLISYTGSPILADFKIVTSLDEAPVGYDPIVTMAGSAPVNFNTRYDKDSDSKNVYIYYQSSVAHVRSTDDVKKKKYVTYVVSDQEYLAGIQAFMVGGKDINNKREMLKKRAKAMGYTLFEPDVAEKTEYYNYPERGAGLFYFRSLSGYIGYATTNNPYRAVGDIRYYKGSAYAQGIQYMAATTDGAYVAMDVNAFGDSGGLAPGKDYVGTSYTLARIAGKAKEPKSWNVEDRMKLREPYEDWQEKWLGVKLDNYYMVGERGLYVLPSSDKYPAMKPSDILVTKDDTPPEGMLPVCYMIDPYMDENFCISPQVYGKTGVHFYVRREEKIRKKYISAINVASFKPAKDMDELNKVVSYKMADDATMLAAYSSTTDGEVLPINIAVNQKNAWYNLLDTLKYNDVDALHDGNISKNAEGDGGEGLHADITIPKSARNYSYVGVSRTDDPDEAIKDIICYYVGNGDAPGKITVGGVRYDKAGDKVGKYCYYTTKSESIGSGLPITELDFDTDVTKGAGSCTIGQVEKTDPANLQNMLDAIDDDEELEPYEKIIKKAELKRKYVSIKIDSQNQLYGHMSVDLTDSFISELYLGCGDTMKAAMEDVMAQGAKHIYTYNTNMGLMDMDRAVNNKHLEFGTNSMNLVDMPKCQYVCIGYNAEFMEDSDPDMGIHDILLTVGKPYQKDGFEKNGCEYYPVSDTSLNAGTDGDDIYMYVTYDASDQADSPIADLALSRGDSTPPGAGLKRYEFIMTDIGEKANLNRGATARKDEQLYDTRLRLFAHRYDNTVKSNALFDITDTGSNTVRYDVAIGG